MTTTPLLTVPPGWDVHPSPSPDTLVLARGHAGWSGVPPELVLRRTEVDPGELVAWRRRAETELRRVLDSCVVEDSEVVDLEGREVFYARLAHRGVGVELLTEQWSWLVGSWGLTLSGTVALEDYADLCEVLEDAAASVEPGVLMSVV